MREAWPWDRAAGTCHRNRQLTILSLFSPNFPLPTDEANTLIRCSVLAMATLLAAAGLLPAAAQAGEVLARVRAGGEVRCGMPRNGSMNSADIDPDGRWVGFFPDFCRAIAAAVVGTANAAQMIQIEGGRQRFDVLNARQVDVVLQNTTVTLNREAVEGVVFPAVYYYDGQGFIARAALNVQNLAELEALNHVNICVFANSTNATHLEDFIKERNLKFDIVQENTNDGLFSAYIARRCDVVSTDRLLLLSNMQQKTYGDVVLLPEVISKEPFAPMVRNDDRDWERLVRWTVYATIQAEELGVTSKNAADRRDHDPNPDVAALLGRTPGLGAALGVTDDWAFRIIAQVGNYGEIFERNLGHASDLQLPRGLNALWTKGGLMYAPPFR